jgi:hypothetical protein
MIGHRGAIAARSDFAKAGHDPDKIIAFAASVTQKTADFQLK